MDLSFNAGTSIKFDISDISMSGYKLVVGTNVDVSSTALSSDKPYVINYNGTAGAVGSYILLTLSGGSTEDTLYYFDQDNSGMGYNPVPDHDKRYEVTVSGNVFYMSLSGGASVITPEITFVKDDIYIFDQSATSNVNEQLVFGYFPDFSYNTKNLEDDGSQEISVVGTPGQSGAYTRVKFKVLPLSTVYYYSTHTLEMGRHFSVPLLSNSYVIGTTSDYQTITNRTVTPEVFSINDFDLETSFTMHIKFKCLGTDLSDSIVFDTPKMRNTKGTTWYNYYGRFQIFTSSDNSVHVRFHETEMFFDLSGVVLNNDAVHFFFKFNKDNDTCVILLYDSSGNNVGTAYEMSDTIQGLTTLIDNTAGQGTLDFLQFIEYKFGGTNYSSIFTDVFVDPPPNRRSTGDQETYLGGTFMTPKSSNDPLLGSIFTPSSDNRIFFMNIYDKATTEEEDKLLIFYTNYVYPAPASMKYFTPKFINDRLLLDLP
jgi:hypothetical protein